MTGQDGEPDPIRDRIRTIPDYPKPGIRFRDVTTLLKDPAGLRIAVDRMLHPYTGARIDKVVGLEARGFVVGGAVAHQISAGFVLIRKQGKLPGQADRESYELEYGTGVMEMHVDAVEPGDKVLLVDDLLATGGTAEAGVKLLERAGADIAGCAFIIELPLLGGRERLADLGMHVHSLCRFDME